MGRGRKRGEKVPVRRPDASPLLDDLGGQRWWLPAVLMTVLVLLVTRRPDAILNPQFFAEDGTVWFADAWNRGGVSALFLPRVGYFQTFPRLVALAAVAVPMTLAPLLFNAAALVVQSLPSVFVLSRRFATTLPHAGARLALALYLAGMPNSYELHGTVTNSQWHLAVLAFLVIAAEPSSKIGWRAFDVVVLILSALTGPFAILLAPVAAARWFFRRERWSAILTIILAGGALIQIGALFAARDDRPGGVLGASPTLLAYLLGGQVFSGATIGGGGYQWLLERQILVPSVAFAVTAAGVALIAYSVARSGLKVRLMVAFAAALFAASLISPIAPDPKWESLAMPGAGLRYWFIPSIAFFSILLVLAGSARAWFVKGVATIVLLLVPIGVAVDWRYPAFDDLQFRAEVERFEAAPRGAEVKIPIFPPGWEMTLTRK